MVTENVVFFRKSQIINFFDSTKIKGIIVKSLLNKRDIVIKPAFIMLVWVSKCSFLLKHKFPNNRKPKSELVIRL